MKHKSGGLIAIGLVIAMILLLLGKCPTDRFATESLPTFGGDSVVLNNTATDEDSDGSTEEAITIVIFIVVVILIFTYITDAEADQTVGR